MRKKISVCFVNALFHPFAGGVEKHLFELSKRLARKGVCVTVVTARIDDSPEHEVIEGVEVHRLRTKVVKVPGLYPPPTTITPSVWMKLKELDEKKNFDVIHLENRWFPDFDVACLYALVHKKPLVITIHNARALGINLAYSIFGSLYDLLIGRWAFESATKIISVSTWAKHDIAQLGINEQKITTIHNGVDVKEFKPENACLEVRRKLGVKENDFFLLFVGRLIEQKGLNYLLQAMPFVLAKHANAKLVIIGRGNLLQDLKKQAKKLGVGENVLFPGFVSEQELKQALASCDLFALPSVWEVLPIAVLEAMASGKPIVCTDAGGDAELVDARNGFVVPKREPQAFANAVNKVLGDNKLRKKLGEASRQRALKEFDWDIIAGKTLEFYEKLLKERKVG